MMVVVATLLRVTAARGRLTVSLPVLWNVGTHRALVVGVHDLSTKEAGSGVR